MKTVEGRHENATVVILDECYFVDCVFDTCFVMYSGGDWGWKNTVFKDCAFQFQGSAMRTVQLLRQFGVLPRGRFPHLSTNKDSELTKEWVQ